MSNYAKLVNGVIEFAPYSKGSIINYNLDEKLMLADGYKPFIKAKTPEDTERYHEFSYEETEDNIVEILTYKETEEEYEERKKQAERERIAMLSLTAADVERAIYKAKGIDFEDIIELVKDNPIIDIKALKIELKANNFYRGNPYVEQIGALLGYTSEDLDYLFGNGELPVKVEEPEEDTQLSDTVEDDSTEESDTVEESEE